MEELGNTPKKESQIEKALNILSNGIGKVQETLPIFESILSSVISQPEKSNPEAEKTTGGQTNLEQRLLKMVDDVANINVYLRELQDRIQL